MARAPVILAGLCICLLARAAGAGDALPEQDFVASVRILYQLQDAVAAGKVDAVGVQTKIIVQLDARFGGPDTLPPSDERDVRAALGYVLGGGPPRLADGLAKADNISPTMKHLLEAAVRFKRGDEETAKKLFKNVDPLTLPPAVGGRIALVQAILTPDEDSTGKLALFNVAIQLMPGTLVEESALRRAALLAASKADFKSLWRSAGRYLRRFSQSPYAGEFTEDLVASFVTLEAEKKMPDRDRLQALLAGLRVDQRRAVFLHMAEKATQERLPDVAQFAARRAVRLSVEGSYEWQRAELYDAVHGVVGNDYDRSLAMLQRIDAGLLAADDRSLLQAALAIGSRIRSPGDTAVVSAAPPPDVPLEHIALLNRADALLKSADSLLASMKNDRSTN